MDGMDYTLGKGGPKAAFSKKCAGNTIEIPVLKGVFEAVQFHTHIGSEHVIGGQRSGAELHIVHKEQGGDRFAVVGIMIDGDGSVDSPIFERLLNKWSALEAKVAADCDGVTPGPKKNRPVGADNSFNVYDLIPAGSSFYHYDGSLTTPPCSEVVWWEVADGILHVSPEQLDRLYKMTTTYTDPSTCELQTAASPIDGSTNRPIAQDIGGREVQKVCPVDSVGSKTPMIVSSADMNPNMIASSFVETNAYPSADTTYDQGYYNQEYNQEFGQGYEQGYDQSYEQGYDQSYHYSGRTHFTADDYDPYAGM